MLLIYLVVERKPKIAATTIKTIENNPSYIRNAIMYSINSGYI